jgi:hypothetical protein
MLEYAIKYWEPVLSGCNPNPLPSLYIEPDVDLLTYFKQNNNLVECAISGTDNPAYDGKTFMAIADRSANLPNARPNFYNVTGLWILTLQNVTSNPSDQTFWNDYPAKNGIVTRRTGPLQSYTAPAQADSNTQLALTASAPDFVDTAPSFTTILNENKKSLFLDNRTVLWLLAALLLIVIIVAMKTDSK